MTSTQMRADRDALSVADVLDRAADLITPEGAWTQNSFCKDGARCIVSAVSQAAMANSQPYLTALGWPHYALATYWNDTPGRTQEEVVSRLRDTAKRLREQGL